MVWANNQREIEARGGVRYGNDGFTIVECASCGWQYLYEHEVERVFYDPIDLSKFFFPFEGYPQPPCVSCGKADFSFQEIAQEETERVKAGPWAWALDE